jgi:hypothetical protein
MGLNKRILSLIIILIAAIAVSCIGAYTYWYYRPNTAVISNGIILSNLIIIDDGKHDAFPDMIYWKDNYYLAYRAAKSHIDTNSSIVILASTNAKKWTAVAELSLADEDIRDPKFAIVNDLLFLYALKNKDIVANPYTTVYTKSVDGENWSDWKDVSPEEWVFWRPKSVDGKIWYVGADDREQKTSALFSSTDGIVWKKLSTIYSGEFNGEIEISFLDGELFSTIRVEGVEGDPKTMIGLSQDPYSSWQLTPSYVTRLDGPCLFSYKGVLFASGRFEPSDKDFSTGSFLNRKRTSIFLVKDTGLTYLTDLPSSGDTSYPTVVVEENKAYIAYYTSDPNKDFPWLIGMTKPTQIRMAVINLDELLLLSTKK